MPRLADRVRRPPVSAVIEAKEDLLLTFGAIEHSVLQVDINWALDPFTPVPPDWSESQADSTPVLPVSPRGENVPDTNKTKPVEMFAPADIEDLLNSLAEDECQVLVRLLRSLDRLATDGNGDPVYSDDEIDVLNQFADLTPVEDDEEDDGVDDLVGDSEEEPEVMSAEASPPEAASTAEAVPLRNDETVAL